MLTLDVRHLLSAYDGIVFYRVWFCTGYIYSYSFGSNVYFTRRSLASSPWTDFAAKRVFFYYALYWTRPPFPLWSVQLHLFKTCFLTSGARVKAGHVPRDTAPAVACTLSWPQVGVRSQRPCCSCLSGRRIVLVHSRAVTHWMRSVTARCWRQPIYRVKESAECPQEPNCKFHKKRRLPYFLACFTQNLFTVWRSLFSHLASQETQPPKLFADSVNRSMTSSELLLNCERKQPHFCTGAKIGSWVICR